jgi:error-prone DNA polymerase
VDGLTAGYAELHCRSAFSLLDGASLPEALAERAASLGLAALALTDRHDLGGAVRFAAAMREGKVDGIHGAEVDVDWGDGAAPSPLVLLAESREGYGNVSTLVTRARMERPRGRASVPLDALAAHAGGVFALTGGPRGRVPALAARGDLAGARMALGTLADVLGGRVAVECWDHGLEEERALTDALRPLAARAGVPWVATNDVYYAAPGGQVVHDVLLALRHGRPLDAMGTRLKPNGEWHLKGAAAMRRRWRHAPEGLRASLEIAARCAFRLDQLRPTLPVFPLPNGVDPDAHLRGLVERGAEERWGARGTPGRTEKHDKQLRHELRLIRRLGLAGYFLIVYDIVRFARSQGILCQGRGSAANSAVCYCLAITAVDPIKMGLLFERFLSEERREAPDIDLDFAHRERERVIQYVYETYGRAHAAMVCEQITWRGKSAVRDAARVLGFSPQQADALSLFSDRFSARATAEVLRGGVDGLAPAADALASALSTHLVAGTEATNRARAVAEEARAVPNGTAVLERRFSHGGSDEAGGADTAGQKPRGCTGGQPAVSEPAHQQRDISLPRRIRTEVSEPPHQNRRSEEGVLSQVGLDPDDPRVRALATVVDGLHQLPRHRSIHVGGFVLTREPLSTVVPVEPASMPGRTVIQWEKDDLDPAGLVKIDLLGLGMLTVLQDCLKYVRATRGVTVDLATLDMADDKVYDMICAADTIGVFQIESRAQMNTLPRLKPRCFYDLVIEVAIIRPGPIQGDMVHPFLRRRAGIEQPDPPHPSVEPILRRTLGVPLFQEQGMQVAIAAAGFTPGEADQLRRAMGHKRSRERMAAICRKLVDGMAKNGIPEEMALRVYQQLNGFADYGFPESHAASFALLVYASAYLRCYYAPEFLAAMLNAQPMGFYAPGTLVEDARRHGVTVLPVDVTRSDYDCTLESPGPAVRLGLRMIRGLGTRARERLEQAVRDGGRFRSVRDLVARSGLDRRGLRLLAESGALDAFVPDEPMLRRRRAAVWRLLEAVRGDAGPLAPQAPSPDVPTAVPTMRPPELTEADYRATGVSLTGHPMRHLREILLPNGVRTAREIRAMRDGTPVAVAGLVICRQRPGTAKGFVFLTLEDETGTVNVVVAPKRFERQALLISRAPLLLVRGVLQVEGAPPTVVVNVRAASFHGLEMTSGAEYARGHDFH